MSLQERISEKISQSCSWRALRGACQLYCCNLTIYIEEDVKGEEKRLLNKDRGASSKTPAFLAFTSGAGAGHAKPAITCSYF
jgi:hypothetical protein